MNKIILEIAALAFCVSVVLFGVQGGSIVDIVSRSFLVFVGVVVLSVVGLVTALLVADRSRQEDVQREEQGAPARKEYGSVGKKHTNGNALS